MDSVWDFQFFKNLARLRVDPPQVALAVLQCRVPKLSVHPGDPGHETVGFDGAKYPPRVRIDLVDLPLPVLAHPQRPFGPREP